MGRFESGTLKMDTRTFRVAVAAMAIGWLPPCLLTAAQSLMTGDGSLHSFLTDYGVSGALADRGAAPDPGTGGGDAAAWRRRAPLSRGRPGAHGAMSAGIAISSIPRAGCATPRSPKSSSPSPASCWLPPSGPCRRRNCRPGIMPVRGRVRRQLVARVRQPAHPQPVAAGLAVAARSVDALSLEGVAPGPASHSVPSRRRRRTEIPRHVAGGARACRPSPSVASSPVPSPTGWCMAGPRS